jgi:hypothetical protein
MKNMPIRFSSESGQSYLVVWALIVAIGVVVLPALAQEGPNGKVCTGINSLPNQEFDTCTGPKNGQCNGQCLSGVSNLTGSCGKCTSGGAGDQCPKSNPMSVSGEAQVGTCKSASATTCTCDYANAERRNVMVACQCND